MKRSALSFRQRKEAAPKPPVIVGYRYPTYTAVLDNQWLHRQLAPVLDKWLWHPIMWDHDMPRRK